MTILRRGKVFWLKKRVPVRYQTVEDRESVWISLHTDSEREAKLKADAAWTTQIEGWELRLAGNTAEAESRFEAAREMAQRRGFSYMPVERVAALPDERLLERLRAVPVKAGKPDKIEAAAILGTVPEPRITVSRALEIYWTLTRAKNLGKSESQIKKWENPIRQAIRDFISVVSDKPMQEITRDDMRLFRDWWIERVETEDLNPTTANKNMDHFGKVLKLVNEEKGLDLVLPLGKLRLEEGERNTRPPFSVAWIKDRLLAPGALDGLHPEARAILLVMVNTGARPSEIRALTASRIHLADSVPHISIEPDGRKLKSRHARRVIPLTGVSLEALRPFPEGFAHFRDDEGLSKEVSEYLTAKGLRQTPAHSLYSLRHAFEDRMLAAGIDERIRRDLMGHRLTRERYGEGANLDHLLALLQAIAL